MIDPAVTSWPSPAFTPSRWPTLSRPFFELEPAFLCAIAFTSFSVRERWGAASGVLAVTSAAAFARERFGAYQRKESAGADFYPRYVELLRGTGRTGAETLARRHLDVTLHAPEFWRDVVRRLEPRVTAFESLVDRLTG